MTVLVSGATRTVGRHVVDHLLRHGQKVCALTRDPAGDTVLEDLFVSPRKRDSARALRAASSATVIGDTS
ncbi:NAD-dependent epimerase/dehydratase family protein [Nonomuraea turcica]|uniref:NAD-dependent epimerase/dehydratase family protein n=1 Tax=Nonomuraea sp. G32 TaxID=3067274 RepID=UPI00273B99DB|nr:NmrA family NAD(P)-binding protein [Nonomuraea sp. G32]MDP4505346.1 NmrA family NAD(P)-binding protein [Nonomuraea sp. G32]